MATAASTSTPSSPLPTTASTLWAQLLNHRGSSKANATQPHSYTQLTPQDKAGTSTRILLHDTHARLEQFSERANSVLSAIETSKREMVRVREEVENAREKELDAIAQLSMFFLYLLPTYMLAGVCSHTAYISQSMPVFSPKDDRSSNASARGRYDADKSHGDNGTTACL
jgi:hypothetical protein